MRPLVLACAAILSASPSIAWAKCGDFGGLGEAVALAAGSGSGLLASAISTVVLRENDGAAPLLAPFLSGAVLGGVVTPGLFFTASLAADCVPNEPGAVVALQVGLSAGMGVVGFVAGHYLFRDAPVSVAVAPTDGGGAVVVGGRF